MAVALRGNLRDFGIADVFQLIGQQRKTGVLEFTGEDGEQVQLRFDRGAVVSAAPVRSRAEEALAEMLVRCGRLRREQVDALVPECEAAAQTVPRLALARGWLDREGLEQIEDLLTRETFFEVLRWESGEFDFRAQPVEHSRRFDTLLGAEQILMDGLRMVDEWHSFSELVPSDDCVFQRVAGFEEYRRRSGLEPARMAQAERVFQLVDGRIPVRRIVDLSLLGSFDAVRLLADLRRAGVIEPLAEDAVQRLQALQRVRPRLDRAEALGWVSGLVAVALLAGLLSWVSGRDRGAAGAPGTAIERSAHAAVLAGYEARGVRHALETHLMASGSWPRTLPELEERELAEAGTMASATGRPYYYVVRESGPLLLAPER